MFSDKNTPEETSKNYKQCLDWTDEKMLIVEKALELLSKHVKRLDELLEDASKNVDESIINQLNEAMEDKKRLKQKKGRKSFKAATEDELDEVDEEGAEPVYCLCQRESHGGMVSCDNVDKCPYEWFHYSCVGLTEPPTGTWVFFSFIFSIVQFVLQK